jgi:serine/threonine-protein kinase haspin
VLTQVVFTLAVAEEAVEFEHRDLHWGNVMVRPAESRTVAFRLRGVDIEVSEKVTMSLLTWCIHILRVMQGHGCG